MPRKVGHIIGDLLETIERLEAKTADCTFTQFESDWELRFIVERGIEVISEARGTCLTRSRPRGRKSSGAVSPGSETFCGTSITSSKVIWAVVKADLPQLKSAIQAIAASEVVAIWDGEPSRSSDEHDSIYDES